LANVLHRHRQALPQTFERGQHGGGVEQLDGPAQRLVSQPAAPEQRTLGGRLRIAPVTPLLAVAAEAEVPPTDPQFGTDRTRMFEQAGRRLGVAAYRRPATAENAGLFEAD